MALWPCLILLMYSRISVTCMVLLPRKYVTKSSFFKCRPRRIDVSTNTATLSSKTTTLNMLHSLLGTIWGTDWSMCWHGRLRVFIYTEFKLRVDYRYEERGEASTGWAGAVLNSLDVWNALPVGTLARLVDSMSRRCAQVNASKRFPN